MGIVAHSMRLQTLLAYRNDLEMRIQGITEELTAVMDRHDELTQIGSPLDSNSDALKKLKAEQEELNLIEKKYELMQKRFQSKLDAVNQEIQSCEQALSKNIEGSFSYTLGGR